MFLLILLLVICTIHGAVGYCDVCVTESLITTSITCPICNQSEIDELAKGSPSGQGSGHTSKSSKHISSRFSNTNSNYYNWTTCFVQAQPCKVSSKYRTVDGSCNNLEHPTWGMSLTAFSRILPAYYRDHRHLLALQTNGKPRPLARILANEIFPDSNHPDSVTLVTMQWGQTVAHDTAISLPISSSSIDCCSRELIQEENICLPIIVPQNDSFYSQFDVTCISEIRTKINLTGNCNYGPAAQIDGNTHSIDASLVYGSDADTGNSLREFTGGKLKTETQNGRKFLPSVAEDQKADSCFIKTIKEPCYMAGDVRVNQNTELSVLQNVFIREHNRLADALRKLHPEWDDEILYQESRAILIAQFQHITYKEWLVLYIGKKNMKKFGLLPKKRGYTEYNSSINIMILNSFATAAYRVPHSGIQGHLRMLNYSRVEVNHVNISDWMVRPKVIQDDNHYDEFLLGLTDQHMQKFDEYYTKQIRNTLFHGFGPYGQDLLTLDIQRGRDHGLAPYVYYLQVCTGYKPTTFEDLKKYIPKKFLPKLEKYYNTIEDIDLIVGSVLEVTVSGARLGPTALCIITEQFYRLKWGDRFWYEVGGQPHSFTKSQIQEIRKASLSKLICDNSDNIHSIAVNSFLPPSERNKIVNCSYLPEVNLNKWK